MRQWFAVKTKPRREVQASVVLAQRGVEVYLPQIPARRRPGRSETPLEPLFPGYLFSRLALATPEWVVARSAPGVAYFLGANGVPSALPDELIENIRERTEETKRHGWQAPFKRGERVVIESGPFAGLEAVFDGTLSARGRVRVFLEVVSRLVPVDLDVSLLNRIG